MAQVADEEMIRESETNLTLCAFRLTLGRAGFYNWRTTEDCFRRDGNAFRCGAVHFPAQGRPFPSLGKSAQLSGGLSCR